MGERLKKAYEVVGKEGGLKAKMRLAVITSVPSSKADTAPDSPENIKKFEDAIKEITGKSVTL